MEYTLTTNQQYCFDQIEGTGGNILVHGSPGTGKSVLIRALIEQGNKRYHVAAPTGLAALNICGRTLHSLFRIPASKGIIAPDYDIYTKDPYVRGFIKSIRHLIIDEISMVRVDIFDYINRLLQNIHGNRLPFGGVQIIAVGDFFQLPPVVVGSENGDIKREYGTPFVFSAPVFESFNILTLSEVLRQKGDDGFIKILHEARTGRVSMASIKALNKRVNPSPIDLRIRLCSTNANATEVNTRHLVAIDAPVEHFSASVTGDWPAFPCDDSLNLKVGAQVMVKKNRADLSGKEKPGTRSLVVNGSLGVITAIERKTYVGDEDAGHEYGENICTVELASGETVPIYIQDWQHSVKFRDEVTGKWTEKVVASFTQMPLAHAWAISMHKSQGQTFDAVHIDPKRVFAPGQLYVALSRCRTLEGLTLESPVNPGMFYANQDVLEFFDSIETE